MGGFLRRARLIAGSVGGGCALISGSLQGAIAIAEVITDRGVTVRTAADTACEGVGVMCACGEQTLRRYLRWVIALADDDDVAKSQDGPVLWAAAVAAMSRSPTPERIEIGVHLRTSGQALRQPWWRSLERWSIVASLSGPVPVLVSSKASLATLVQPVSLRPCSPAHL